MPMISSKARFAYTNPPSGTVATHTPAGRSSAIDAISARSSAERMPVPAARSAGVDDVDDFLHGGRARGDHLLLVVAERDLHHLLHAARADDARHAHEEALEAVFA